MAQVTTPEMLIDANLAALGRSDATVGWLFDFENAQTSEDLEECLSTAPTLIAAALVVGRLMGAREAAYAASMVAHAFSQQGDVEAPARH